MEGINRFKECVMTENQEIVPAIFEGWHTYQEVIIKALRPLDEDQLNLRAAPNLRSVDEIARHMVGARARWFYMLMGEGGEAFEAMGKWDRRGAEFRSAGELVNGLERTWQGMQAAIASWSPEDWQKTWPGEDGSEPEILTRQWVIWHLIEHDLHHGGEISLTLGVHGIPALDI
jgi:uncharacterized damage-inducible protein DinB